MSRFETDALNPSSLPSANLGRRRPAFDPSAGSDAAGAGRGSREDAQLDAWAEELNKRVDKDVKAALGGLKELVEVEAGPASPSGAAVGPGGGSAAGSVVSAEPEPVLNALHLKIRTAALIRACQNIRDTAHELKLLLALGDPVGDAQNRDAEMRRVRADVALARRDVATQVAELVLPGSTAVSSTTTATATADVQAAVNGNPGSDRPASLINGATAPALASSSSPAPTLGLDTPQPVLSSTPTLALEAERSPSSTPTLPAPEPSSTPTLPALEPSSTPTLPALEPSSTPTLPLPAEPLPESSSAPGQHTDSDDNDMDIDEDLEEVPM